MTYKEFPCTVKEMNQADIAWFSGFFEGEGNVSVTKKGRHVHLRISQKDRSLLDRVKDITGVGTVVLRTNHSRPGQDYYVWQTGAKANVCALMKAMFPYVYGPKRKELLEAWLGYVHPEDGLNG